MLSGDCGFCLEGEGMSGHRFTDEEAVLVLRKGREPRSQDRTDAKADVGAGLPASSDRRRRPDLSEPTEPAESPQAAVVRVRLEPATRNPAPTVEGLHRQPGISNYYLGNDPTKWRSGVPHYARVRYEDVYPGVDLIVYGNPQQLKYGFVVTRGADPEQIRVSFDGVDGMHINEEGNLVLTVNGGEIVQRAPRVYRRSDGGRRPVTGQIA
jgi:hypothetical protein